jgi:hypothetical protein
MAASSRQERKQCSNFGGRLSANREAPAKGERSVHMCVEGCWSIGREQFSRRCRISLERCSRFTGKLVPVEIGIT